MAFHFKNTKKDFFVTAEDEEDYRNFTICRFCEKTFEFDKLGDHCHLTVNYRGPVNNTCNINVTLKQSSFNPFFSQV